MSATIWILDDDPSMRWVLERALAKAGYAQQSFADPGALLQALEAGPPDLLLSDIRMPGMDGLELLARVQQRWPELPVIIMTAHSDLDSAVRAHREGAFDYLAKPFDLNLLLDPVRRALSTPKPAPSHATEPPSTPLIGESPALQALFRAIGRLAHTHLNVLITGESGTGKELVAQALHQHSPRAERPLIPLNMAAIPQDLIEAELFGHAKGAFTGASQARPGRFQQAHGGTLFLDEIGDMPASAQTRLLRVLSSGEFFPVGGERPVRVDVRIIAATHQNLAARVASGQFREDLYHRLNVISLELPPLRARRGDIALLSQHFLQRAARNLGTAPKQLTDEALSLMQRYAWPGNVRQLENLCQRLSVMALGQSIFATDLPPELQACATEHGLQHTPAPTGAGDWQAALRHQAEHLLAHATPLIPHLQPQLERLLIETALAHSQGHKSEAARLLGWGRNTLTRKLKELNLETP